MYSKLLLRNIPRSIRITSTSATLIVNIFINNYDKTFTSGNLVPTLSVHLDRNLIIPKWKATRHKESKKLHQDFQEFLRNKHTETWKILTGI